MPDPGMSGMCSASHASRSVWRGSCSTPRARPSRPSGPRNVVSVVPSCSATSLTTRSLAVAVQPSTGTRPDPKPADEAADPPVVGAEVVTPVGDAVHLVDHDEPGLAAEHRHDRGGELGVGQPFGRHEHEVDVVGGCSRSVSSATVVLVDELTVMHRSPRRLAARIWLRISASSGEIEQRRPEPLLAQDAGGDEVDRALAPPGALHDEHPLAPHAQRLDRLPLPVAELGAPGCRSATATRRATRRPSGCSVRSGRSPGGWSRCPPWTSSMAEGCDAPPRPAFS